MRNAHRGVETTKGARSTDLVLTTFPTILVIVFQGSINEEFMKRYMNIN